MRKIKGFNFTGTWVDEGLNYIESELGITLTDEQLHQIGILWDWNYDNHDALVMTHIGLNAEQYEAYLDVNND